jgi:hypothetical protein
MLHFLKVDWEIFHNALAAYATVGATVVALIAAIWSIKQVREQIKIQNDFERRRLEEGYLRDALNIVHGIFFSAQAFVASTNQFDIYAEENEFTEKEKTPFLREIQKDFRDSWKHFDQVISATIRILENTQGANRALLDELRVLFHASANLHDLLLDNSGSSRNYKDDWDLENEPRAQLVKRSADAAAASISQRLASLYSNTTAR